MRTIQKIIISIYCAIVMIWLYLFMWIITFQWTIPILPAYSLFLLTIGIRTIILEFIAFTAIFGVLFVITLIPKKVQDLQQLQK